MSEQNKIEKLREIAGNQLPEPMLLIAFLEHQMDLVSKIIIDNEKVFSKESQEYIEQLKSIMVHSSVNFSNIESPLESYKIPKTKQNKERTRIIQEKYLQSQLQAGLIR